MTAAEQKQMIVTWQIYFCSRCSSKAKQSSNEGSRPSSAGCERGRRRTRSVSAEAREFIVFFLVQICSIAKSGDNRQEYLAIFDYKLNYESKVLKNFLLCFWLPILNNVSKYGDYFLNFGLIMAIENLKKHMILVFFLNSILAIYSQPKNI
jgi:hypothetical protein